MVIGSLPKAVTAGLHFQSFERPLGELLVILGVSLRPFKMW